MSGLSDGAARNGNGTHVTAEDVLDDAPLDATEAAAGAERASEPVAESLAQAVARVVAGLPGTTRRPDATGGDELVAAGAVFAVAHPDALEVLLDGPVARAALATADTEASARGTGWVRFTPRVMDRYAADRAEAWLAFAHRRTAERAR